MSTETLKASAKAGRRIRTSARWMSRPAEMEDVSKVMDHLLPSCRQPERDERKEKW